jgi:hypothetical protein
MGENMKYLFAAVLLAGTVAGFSAADAAGGCGPGWHRGAYGECHPNRRIVRVERRLFERRVMGPRRIDPRLFEKGVVGPNRIDPRLFEKGVVGPRGRR